MRERQVEVLLCSVCVLFQAGAYGSRQIAAHAVTLSS